MSEDPRKEPRTSLPRGLLEKHWNPYFIETGTHEGAGIEQALAVGFKMIHSIEIDRGRAAAAAVKYTECDNVYIHLGDTVDVLPRLMNGVFERATIWLDAHACSLDEERGGVKWPLMRELEILARARRRDHTILVDDRRHFKAFFGVEEREVVAALRNVNPRYMIGHADSLHHKLDILVAMVP